MPSIIEQHYYREFSYSDLDGWHYRLSFENFDRSIDEYNRFRRLNVEVSNDDKQSWRSLPLALSLTSKMRLWLSASPEWPPEIVVALGGERTTVWFDYEDNVDELGWMGWPSRWRALFDSRKGQWRLKRLHILNKAVQKASASTLPR